MSKPNATLKVLGTLALSCLPLVAATISSEDEVRIRLSGQVQALSADHFQIASGADALLEIAASPGDMVWCFAVAEDIWGEANYSQILTLVYAQAPRADGVVQSWIHVPPDVAGLIFHVQAVAVDAKGELKSSQMVTVVVPGVVILLPPAPGSSAASPLLDN
jgi:hypothetical protein